MNDENNKTIEKFTFLEAHLAWLYGHIPTAHQLNTVKFCLVGFVILLILFAFGTTISKTLEYADSERALRETYSTYLEPSKIIANKMFVEEGQVYIVGRLADYPTSIPELVERQGQLERQFDTMKKLMDGVLARLRENESEIKKLKPIKVIK